MSDNDSSIDKQIRDIDMAIEGNSEEPQTEANEKRIAELEQERSNLQALKNKDDDK